MNADSATLFLFPQNTDSPEDSIFAEMERSAEKGRDVKWEAGELTVHLKSVPDDSDPKNSSPRFREIVSDTDIYSPRLIADLARIDCESMEHTGSIPTFRRQFFDCTIGAAAIFSGLCVVAGILGFCAFLIGVAIPFGLFS